MGGYCEVLNHCFSMSLCSLQVEPLIVVMRFSRVNLTVAEGEVMCIHLKKGD